MGERRAGRREKLGSNPIVSMYPLLKTQTSLTRRITDTDKLVVLHAKP